MTTMMRPHRHCRNQHRRNRHRSRRPQWLALAALTALALLAAACGGPRSVSLADLTWDMERYDGDEVTTSGVVLFFGEDEGAIIDHYVIQDAEANRVKLLPEEAAAPHVGSAVTVTGLFEYGPESGRILHVESIERAR